MAPEHKRNFISRTLNRPTTSGKLVFILLLCIVVYTMYQRLHIIRDNDRREMANIAQVVYSNIDQALKNANTTALTLALTINDKGTPEDFNAIGKQLTESNPGIDGVQLVPDGVIKYVYPIQDSAAIGLDILHTKGVREEALKAIQLRKMYFAGPLQLRQGGTGIVGRLPVYQNNKFWGFSAVIIRLETLVKLAGMHSIDDSKYYFQLSTKDPVSGKEVFFLADKSDFSDKYYNSLTFSDNGWKLYVITKDKFGIYRQMLPVAILSILLIVLVALFILLLLKKPAELEKLVNKQASKLLNNEIRYKAIFDNAGVGIAHINSITGEFIEANEQYCKIMEFSKAELLTKSFTEICYAEDLLQDLSQMEDMKAGKIFGFSMEKRLIKKSGEAVWINLTVSPLWEPGSTPTTHIAIIEDISLTKETKEQISRSEARFKSLFDDSPVALWEEDFSEVKKYLGSLNLIGETPKAVLTYLNGHPEVLQQCIKLIKILDVNNESLRLHNADSKEQLIASCVNVMLNEDSVKAFSKQFVAVTSGSSQMMIETRFRKPTGEFCDIFLRWSVMRGYEETLGRVIISTEDITAQKEAERIISNSQKQIETLINSIDGIVWESNYDNYEFTFVNQKAEEISGYSVEEWLHDGAFWAKTIHPDDKDNAMAFCSAQSKLQKQYSFEYRMIAKDGSVLWIRDIVNVIHENGQPKRLRGIMIDITKSKEAENDLNKSFALVTEQNKRLHNFSYIVSHNLRSHTSNIQSITNLIDLADSEEERDELLGMLKKVSASLNDTIQHLSDLLNIQSNVASVKENLNLSHYIKNTLNILSEQITTQDITVINNIAEDINVNYNPAYLESILLNLLSNAIRYRSTSRKPFISIDWATENEIGVLKIGDNGIGIDMNKNGDKLFGMYKTFHGNSDARGIGLFITRNQVEAMGGSISVESELGSGTTFKIYFK
jgi:PAS domain S-box-containing protein